MNKMLAVLFAALLALSIACAWAEEAAEPTVYISGDWEYVLLEDGTAEIHYYHGGFEELLVPQEIDGYAVTAIGDYAFFMAAMTSVTIPDSVTAIGTNPFAYCNKLTGIIVSPDHPTLATIDGILFDKVEKKLICYPHASMNTSYVIPQGIRVIGDYAFYDCDFLTSITLPDSVTTIGDSAFSRCYSLTSITLPDSITTIGVNPFADCRKLTDIIVSPDHPTLAIIDGVLFDKTEKKLICYPYANQNGNYTIPQGILSIGDSAFYECRHLRSITIPDSVTVIGDGAFSGTPLTSVTVPDSVTTIGGSAFSRCDYLMSITLPDSVTTIGGSAFFTRRVRQRSFTVPRGSYAEEWALANGYTCTYMKPTGLSHGDLTYRIQADGSAIIIGCTTEAATLEIPAAIDGAPVTAIGAYAFENCATLTGVTLPDTLTSIADTAFEGCGSITFTVPRNSYAAQWCKDNGLRYTYPDANDWLLD